MSPLRLNLSALTHNAAKWPLPGKALLGCALASLIFVVGDLVYLSPSRQRLSQVEVREVALQQQVAQKTALAASLEARVQQFQLMQAKADELFRALPGKSEMPGLLEDIAHLAVVNGLVVESVTPSDEQSQPYYHEQPVQVGVAGAYHDLATFLSSLGGWRELRRCMMLSCDGMASCCALIYWSRAIGCRAVGEVVRPANDNPLSTRLPGCATLFSGLPFRSITCLGGQPVRQISPGHAQPWKALRWTSSKWSARCPAGRRSSPCCVRPPRCIAWRSVTTWGRTMAGSRPSMSVT